MDKGFIYTVIKNRKITLAVVVFLMLMGMYSYYVTPKQEDPDFNAPVAMITAVYPGASPEDVERLVTCKIEDEAAEVDGYDYCTSESKNSLSVVILFLDQDADTDQAWAQLRQKMDDLQSRLPAGCGNIEINTDLHETAGIIISMSGENYSYEELASYAEDFKKQLSRIKGIARFDLAGKQEKEVKVEVDAARLNFFNLSLEDVIKVISVQNMKMPSGRIDDGNVRITVNAPGDYASLTEIENTIIAVSEKTGAAVRIKDIAEVYMGLEDAAYKIKQNGRNAVLLVGYFKEDENIVMVGRDVEKRLEELKAGLPEDIVFDRVLYQPEDISRSVNGFMINLLEGMLFVIVVVFAGMGFRNALIVSTAIPVSILLTFMGMGIMGIKIHQISITALLIALGMLVDNAIVVSDAIQVRMDSGQDKLDACIEGVKEVAVPVLTSTLTTIGAFVPLLTLNSMAGDYISSIPRIVILALASSYLVALFVAPTVSYLFFEKGNSAERVSWARRLYSHVLHMGFRNTKITILAALIAFSLAMCIAGQMGLQFFPKADKDIIYIDISADRNGNLSRTEEIADTVSGILEQQEEVKGYTAAIGGKMPKFYDTVPPPVQSQDTAQVLVRVDLDRGKRFRTNSQLADYLQGIFDATITGGTATVKLLEKAKPIGAPIRVRISGDDMERLGEVSREIKEMLREVSGTINVRDDFTEKTYEFYIQVDEDKASRYGVSKYDIQKEVSIALMGNQASIFRKNGNEYDIVVKSDIASREDLENFAIKSSATGRKVLLKEIADISMITRLPSIRKYDRDMCLTVYSDLRSGYGPVEIEERLKEKLEEADMHDVNIEFAGETKEIRDNFGDIGVSAVFAVLVVYGILLIQFNSFIQPLIILLTIPLASIGSILGLWLFRQPLSFTGLLGIVSLLGIVVNNAIILTDFINSERRRGAAVERACVKAVDKRLRPIILSTATTAVGLIPLAVSGGDLFRPLAIALIGGLMVSTLLTLVVIPVVYNAVENRVITPFKASS